MSSFPILDLVVGLIFIYFLLSIICSSVVEMAMTVGKIRGKVLASWLMHIFDKTVQLPDGKTVPLGQAIMDHCSVTALSEDNKSPSYIDAKNFTSALLEKITFDPADPKSIATDLNSLISKIEKSEALSHELQRVLLTYAYEAKNSMQAINSAVSALDIFRSKLEDWYNSSMQRITGTLKQKYARPFTIWVGIIATLFLNADSISIAKYLYTNPEARAQILTAAYKEVNDSAAKYNERLATMRSINADTAATQTQLDEAIKAGSNNIEEAKAALSIPLGWDIAYFRGLSGIDGFLSILTKIIGLAVTVFAIIMGAPFWFDLLNKIANIRGSGTKPEGSPDDGNPSGNTSTAATPAPVSLSINTNSGMEAVG